MSKIVECPCYKSGFWAVDRNSMASGLFKLEPNGEVSRYNESGGREFTESRGFYAQWFDLSPLFNQEKDMSGYTEPAQWDSALRARVIEYLLFRENIQGRTDSVKHLNALSQLGFFGDPVDSTKDDFGTIQSILLNYLKTQCNDGEAKALKFLGYGPKMAWVEKEGTAGAIRQMVKDGHKIGLTNSGVAIVKGLNWDKGLSNLPSATKMNYWIKEEVE